GMGGPHILFSFRFQNQSPLPRRRVPKRICRPPHGRSTERADDTGSFCAQEKWRLVLESEPCIIIGERDGWGHPQRFGVSKEDQRQHIYIIGKTGTGKTTLLRN